MTNTPSKAALDLAVKPVGYSSWEEFDRWYAQANDTLLRAMALAYAADLDKADKVARVVLAHSGWLTDHDDARELILPDPVDPDLLEEREMSAKFYEAILPFLPNLDRFQLAGIKDELRRLAKRGRELAKEQDRG